MGKEAFIITSAEKVEALFTSLDTFSRDVAVEFERISKKVDELENRTKHIQQEFDCVCQEYFEKIARYGNLTTQDIKTLLRDGCTENWMDPYAITFLRDITATNEENLWGRLSISQVRYLVYLIEKSKYWKDKAQAAKGEPLSASSTLEPLVEKETFATEESPSPPADEIV